MCDFNNSVLARRIFFAVLMFRQNGIAPPGVGQIKCKIIFRIVIADGQIGGVVVN